MNEVVETVQGRKLDARYTLQEKLGTGGQGEVWRAHDRVRGVDIALKVLNPDFTRSEAAWAALEHEYNISSRLNHPGILKVFPPERSGDALVLPMELASGGDLRRLRGASFLEIIPVLLEIAQALEHAHERGVVHRDLKPGNVLFDSRARVRLADFGVAGTAGESADAKGSRDGTEAPKHGLSPFTASPAQLRGEPPTPGDDIYGLGALAYELLSGYPPYYPNFNRKRAIEEPVPELVPTQQIPPLLRALVMRMLAKEPRQRPTAMREIIDELDASLNETLIFEFDDEAPSNDTEPTRVLSGASAPQRPASTAPPPRPPSTVAPRPSAGGHSSSAGIHGPGPLRTMFVTDTPAANMPEGPPREWSQTPGRDRRSSSDRRSRPRIEPVFNPPPIPGQGSSQGTESTQARSAGAVSRAPTLRDDRRAHPPERQAAPADTDAATASSGDAPGTAVIPARGASAKPHPFLRNELTPRPAAVPAVPARSTNHPTWGDIELDALPRVARERLRQQQTVHSRRWPWVLLGLCAGAAAAVYFWLPRFDPQSLPGQVSALVEPLRTTITRDLLHEKPSHSVAPAEPAADAAPATAANPPPSSNGESDARATAVPAPSAKDTGASPTAGVNPTAGQTAKPSQERVRASGPSEERLRIMRQTFDTRLAMLDARGAAAWGGRDFATAKMRAAESVGAHDAGNTPMALERLTVAARLLDRVESKAPQALTEQVAAGEKALGTGQPEAAGQAVEPSRRLEPTDRRAPDGQRHSQNLNGILALLGDAQNAESAHQYARAAQDYSQALSLDPNNATAKAGQMRANAAFGADSYAKAVGAGFAALGAGRLDEAHDDFSKARALKANGAEAAEGLRRVSAALTARGFASIRARASGLETQERWSEAEQAYESVLAADPSLAFAREGRARAASRAELSERLQQLIDRPERFSHGSGREDAQALLETAQAQTPSGPVLRSQIARIQILLSGGDRVASERSVGDKPVRLSLQSDNSTQVAIPSIGSFGSFSHREIELRPGKYIVVGTRNGFREVRREITVTAGQGTQTIRVSCSEPI